MTTSEIFMGIGLTFALAVGCQIVAGKFKLPAIVLLLPVGHLARRFTSTVDPVMTLGPAFVPLVGLAVAIILFDGGLDLSFTELEGHSRRVTRRLLALGIPVTWAGASLFAWWLLGLSGQAAIMLGAILIVSGPTVVTPLLSIARPNHRVRSILAWEGTTVDPIGAIIGALTFVAIKARVGFQPGTELLDFLAAAGIGLAGGAVGTALLWFLLGKLRLTGTLATEATVATVVFVAATCNAISDDTGLIAAITMGVALANLPGIDTPEDRRFFKTIVQLVIGLLFISISATVAPGSLRDLVWPTIGLICCLVLFVRPLVAAMATVRTSLSRKERAFIGWMDPRGIVAASTAATFAAPLVAAKVDGADKLLPVTFLVIVGTVLIYGLTAKPVVRLLGIGEAEPDPSPGVAGAASDGDQSPAVPEAATARSEAPEP